MAIHIDPFYLAVKGIGQVIGQVISLKIDRGRTGIQDLDPLQVITPRS